MNLEMLRALAPNDMRRSAANVLVIMLAVTAAACARDSATEPFRPGADGPALLHLRKDYIDDQVGLPGDEVDPPTVVVEDQFGNYVSGVTVNFSVSSGGGSVAKTQVEARGYASSEGWTLGTRPGLNSVVASAAGLNSVTFNARALDAGAITWYDLPAASIRLITSASIALCENGIFELKTVETSDALTGEWRDSQFGKYSLQGDKLVLTYATGLTEEGTLVDDRLSLMHTKENWVHEPAQAWNFVKRK